MLIYQRVIIHSPEEFGFLSGPFPAFPCNRVEGPPSLHLLPVLLSEDRDIPGSRILKYRGAISTIQCGYIVMGVYD